MKNTLYVGNTQKFNAFLLFYVVTASQIGVGIHGFQRVLYSEAKQDAWISLVLSFVLAHIAVMVMMKTLDMYESNDLYGIHLDIFGKYFGNFLNFIYIVYCMAAFLAILKNYIEVINTWVFPYLDTIFLCITILIIVVYAFSGGLRVIVGICFFSFFFILWIPPILIFPLHYSDLNFLLPVLDTELKGIAKGVLSMSFTIIGFEIINIIYPFVKEKDKYKRYVHFGLLFTLFLYLSILLISLTFFSGEQLSKTIWATLTLFSIIRLPFIERVEIITICIWLIIILPNLCLYMWSAYRGVLRMKFISTKKFTFFFVLIIFVVNLYVNKRATINMLNDYFGKVAFIVVFVYPFILFLFAFIKKKIKKSQVSKNEEN
ncbi:spore germination protein (amino acid permease) [Ureibacillus xyleni]|uniref:Spore germination protein (Amino acid permease) n=1 Tax=Ureibacillus xyleni TaxID=614648 RepID=A0A285TPK3_9BACL|nr:GerAB/ArcD/ProY family transporter [Ureibacillus xyleni]SOC22628.1 spore germination protein (amino acid permease) [Ureibacillus xyleni]